MRKPVQHSTWCMFKHILTILTTSTQQPRAKDRMPPDPPNQILRGETGWVHRFRISSLTRVQESIRECAKVSFFLSAQHNKMMTAQFPSWRLQVHSAISLTLLLFAEAHSHDITSAAKLPKGLFLGEVQANCTSNPCERGTCSKPSGTCNGGPVLGGQYCCTCPVGWAGVRCEIQALIAVVFSSNMVRNKLLSPSLLVSGRLRHGEVFEASLWDNTC